MVVHLARALARRPYGELSRAGRGRRRFARVDWWFNLAAEIDTPEGRRALDRPDISRRIAAPSRAAISVLAGRRLRLGGAPRSPTRSSVPSRPGARRRGARN